MKILVDGKEKILEIVDDNDTEWTQDLIGNCGWKNAGFTKDEETGLWSCDQDNYEWWETYISNFYKVAEETRKLVDEFDLDLEDVKERISEAIYPCNMEDEYDKAMSEIATIREENQ